MLRRSAHLAFVVALTALTMGGLSACGDSGDGTGNGGLSLVDKAKTAQVCLDVAGLVQSTAAVGAKVGAGSLTEAQARAELEPIATRVNALATDNASLPIGKGLQELSKKGHRAAGGQRQGSC